MAWEQIYNNTEYASRKMYTGEKVIVYITLSPSGQGFVNVYSSLDTVGYDIKYYSYTATNEVKIKYEVGLKIDGVRYTVQTELLADNSNTTTRQYAEDIYTAKKGALVETEYVRIYREIPNTAPTVPSNISVPSTVEGGKTLLISWGSSSDADGNLSGYKLERSVNGGIFTQVYSGSSRSHTDSITKGWNTVTYRVRAYDSQNAHSGYTTSPTRTVTNNTPPTISGSDSNLGDKSLGFVISYQVDDADTSDTLIVIEKLNGSTIKTINGAPRKQELEIEITNETLYSLPLNSENTIEIKVDDQQGGIAYRRYTFRRTNTAPIISNEDQNLGRKIEPFSIDFSASDNEGNVITIKTYLDGIKKEEYQVEDGATNTFTISSEDWYRLGIGNHSIKIEAIDEHGAIAIRNYTFTRYDDKIKFTLKNPIETDIAATKILITPTCVIPIGANVKVEVCNNGYDEIPTWEDITSQVSTGKHYMITNDIKTADKWGIDIRFTIEKGTATEKCVIYGFGGAFE